MTTTKSDFWVFSNAEGAGSKKGEEKRWAIETPHDLHVLGKIKYHDGPVRVPPLIADAERPDRIEDVPWVHDGFYIVSDRVKAIFETAGPSDCQFIPIDIRFRGRSLGLIYWAMHVLNTVDCADPEQSSNSPMPDGTPYYYRVSIIPEKVPPHGSTFRVRHGSSSAVVRDPLRRALQRAKVTGCMFYLP